MRRPLAEAEVAAATLVGLLRPGCERIEVAGSIRRRAADVKDIEVVAVPRFGADMFNSTGDDLLNDQIRYLATSRTIRYRNQRKDEPVAEYNMRDRRYYPLWLPWGDGLFAVDLFCVRPPAQWGAIFAIRTGPADYSRLLVTMAQAADLRCIEGHLVSTSPGDIGRTVNTPEERDFIEACGLPFLPPEQRK